MNSQTLRLPNIRVPHSLVANRSRFGGWVDGAYLCGDLIIRNGKVERLDPPSESATPRLLLPRFTEVHVHLDKCHSVDRMPSVGGDLRAAIAAQSADKAHWSAEDLRARATRGLEELIAAGCKSVRSHVDWPNGEAARTPPLAWYILSEIAQDHRDKIDLQLSPLTNLADLSDPVTAQVLGKATAQANGALGCFVHDHLNRTPGIRAAFDIARRYDLMLDFHVDEGLATGLDGLAIIAQTALEMGCERAILCGHACSLMNLSGAKLDQSIDLIAQSGLSVATLPTTNLYLQGRVDGTPDRRGITRIREMQAADVSVVVGTDNVRDAFCPLGRHDPRASLALAVLGAHLDPPLAELWPMITTAAEQALGLAPTFVDCASVSDLILCDAPSSSSALTCDALPQPLANHLEGPSQ